MRRDQGQSSAARGDGRLYLEGNDRVQLCHDVDFLNYLRAQFGVDPHPSGPGRFICHSPFRDERTPSFTVYAPGVGRMGHRGWTWCDYGAGNRNGDALALDMEANHTSFPEAAHRLAMFTLSPEEWIADPAAAAALRRSVAPPQAPKHEHIPIATQRQAFAALIHAIEVVDPAASVKGRDYLRLRGASDCAIDLMGPAYRMDSALVTNAVARELAKDRDTFNAAIESGICYDIRKYPHLLPKLYWQGDTVLMPCLNRTGDRQVYSVGRRMDWHENDTYPKYLLASCARGAQRAPYGLPSLAIAARQQETLVICEGALDALGAESLGMHGLAMLGRPCAGEIDDQVGACARQLHWVLDDLQSCREVLVLPDNDGESQSTIDGIEGAMRLVAWLQARSVHATCVSMDDIGFGSYKDLAEASAARSTYQHLAESTKHIRN